MTEELDNDTCISNWRLNNFFITIDNSINNATLFSTNDFMNNNGTTSNNNNNIAHQVHTKIAVVDEGVKEGL